ncbi:MAG TPA: 5-deoxy-glucuronate isomerase [Thermoanaerobaculia bacterium]|nr:5-deoxy-glucuronate isomerase [Thermoanaerobaculia bacterium]
MSLPEIDAQTCVVRDTARHRGRHISVKPGLTAARHLHYGRIVLEGEAVAFSTEDRETAFICLRGTATIATHGESFDVTPYDALYVPRDSQVSVEGNCDIAEVAAPVDHQYPLQFVKFADVQNDPALHFETGGPSSQRSLNILIGRNVEAGRILAGVTFSKPGNWTSWPPHEHANLAEEAYLYIDMPEPGWGLQLVYTDPRNPELVAVVKQDDVVIMPRGYHPNVSAPGGTINFLWMMAANREVEDRQFGVVNVHPDYAQGGSGLEASRK